MAKEKKWFIPQKVWMLETVPEEQCQALKVASKHNGWGVIPVRVQIGETEWETSLFPKDDRYILPIKASVRKAGSLAEGGLVTVYLEV